MNFDNNGKAKMNKKVGIDFETMALHILTLEKIGREHDVKIKKVIVKTELKNDLYNTKYGTELKKKNIYFVKHLSPLLNNLHDDHYHIDFEIISPAQ